MNKSAFITQASIQAAFIAISSRIVGSAFRFLETLNPLFQKTQVIADPPTVLVRELVTISMAWLLSLTTHMLIKQITRKHPFWGQFVTTVIGTAAAESIGRLVAYRKALKMQTDLPAGNPAPKKLPPAIPPRPSARPIPLYGMPQMPGNGIIRVYR